MRSVDESSLLSWSVEPPTWLSAAGSYPASATRGHPPHTPPEASVFLYIICTYTNIYIDRYR